MIRNADDFGLGAEVNRGVLGAFEAGLVTHASVMANQEGFEEACALARERDLSGRLGAHLVLTRGEPLTEPMRRCRRFCDGEGRFLEWRGDARAFRLERADRDAVAGELHAQVERCRAAGLEVAHLDSHHHVHNEWAVGGIVIRLARELGVPRVRIARNCGTGMSLAARGYKRLFNARLRRARLAGTRYFGDVEDWLELRRQGAAPRELDDYELMTHPLAGPDGSVVDAELDRRPLDELLAPVLALA